MTHNVVAHYLDGTLLKGVCLTVDPKRPMCHIDTRERGTVQVRLADLKALYFVRSLEGNPAHREDNSLDPDDPRRIGARVVEVIFRDGERLVAITPHFPPRNLFFALPADLKSNNDRVLVNQAACRSITPHE